MEEFSRIAVIRLSSVGDVLMAMPAVEATRRRYPEAHITWIVEPRARNLLEGFAAIDEIVEFPRPRIRELQKRHFWILRSVPVLWKLRRELRRRRFDLSIDFQGNLKSGLCTWMAGARVRVGYGRPECREPNWLFTNRRLPLKGQKLHRMDRDLLLAGLAHVPFRFEMPHVTFTEHDRRVGLAVVPDLTSSPPVVIFHPGTSDFMPNKRWPLEHYAHLGDRLVAEAGVRLLLSWGPGEQARAEDLRSRLSQPSELLPPTDSMKSLGFVLSRADLMVGGDTGPTHLASALGVPTLIILGPGDPRYYYPHGHPERVFFRRMPCAPCRNRGCELRTCLEDIHPDLVADQALEVLASLGH